jgi:Cupredoxin-like domain
VSSPITTLAMKCIRTAKALSYLIITLSPYVAQAEWNVDFTRRQSQMTNAKPMDIAADPAVSVAKPVESNIFDRVFNTVVPAQEIVILNTDQGFIPSTVRVKEGAQYRIVVVNINEKSRNVSFVLDSFSEHHATFYGKVKSFYINPKKEGVYTFMSPETSAQGRLVVHPSQGPANSMSSDVRSPASE